MTDTTWLQSDMTTSSSTLRIHQSSEELGIFQKQNSWFAGTITTLTWTTGIFITACHSREGEAGLKLLSTLVDSNKKGFIKYFVVILFLNSDS